MILGRVGSDLSDGAILCTLMADQHGYCARPKRRYRARCYPFGPSPTTGTNHSPSCHFLYHRKSADQQVKLLLTYLAGTLMSCNHVRICQYVQGQLYRCTAVNQCTCRYCKSSFSFGPGNVCSHYLDDH